MTRAALTCCLFGVVALVGCRGQQEAYRPTARPPATRVDGVRDESFGVTVVDDYRWLEGAANPDGSNPGQMTSEVSAWTAGERQYARAVLDAVPNRAAIETRLASFMDIGDLSLPLVGGNRYFFWQRNAGQPLPVIFVRDGALGADRALFGAGDFDPGGAVTVQWIMPSQDGKWLAVGLGGADPGRSVLRLFDVDRGRFTALEIGGGPRAVYWLPDSTRFIYQRPIDPVDPASVAVFLHQRDEDPSRDRLLLRLGAPGGASRSVYAPPFASLSSDGRWLVVNRPGTAASNDLALIDMTALGTGRASAPRMATGRTSGRAVGTVLGQTLFVHTTRGAPNGRVVAVEVDRPDEARWRDVVPERRDPIESVAFGRGLIAVTYLQHASNVTEVFDLSGRSLGPLRQPGIGTTSLAASEDRTDAFLLFQSFNRPPTVFRVDLAAPAAPPVLWKGGLAPIDPDGFTVELVRYPSKDGTEISMFLARRTDVAPNGARPTLLVGYGAFGVRMLPSFSPTWAEWLQSGGVLAVPHVRGGGEYGEGWHAAGARQGKRRSFDDFIAAAEWLVANRHATADTLAAFGDAGGGLLAGGALVDRPDLFKAVVLVNPLLDMLRYDRFLDARGWTPEFGSPSDPDAFEWLWGYSPYRHVQPGTRYPAVLLMGSDLSPVHPMHVRKMAARLRAATTGEAADRPILLAIDRPEDAPVTRALQAMVDQQAFLAWQLGMR